jgi:signal transduction histidine kinase
MSGGPQETDALRTLGSLTRGALHEIANPLVALVGSAELALGETEPETKLHDRIALTRQTGTEIAEIVKALQAFVRLQAEPPAELSVGAEAQAAVALVSRVMPTGNRSLTASGDATVHASPGALRSRLVDLLLEALERADREEPVELVVAGGAVTATGGGRLAL